MEYYPNTMNSDYFNNWYVQMNLICWARGTVMIGLLFTVERISEGVVGLMCMGITDRLGRRKSALIFIAIALLSQTIIIFCPWYWARMFGFILFAIGNMKNSVCYVWIFEMMETKHKSSACTLINALDSSTMIFFGLYVLFISTNWKWIEIFMYCVGWLSFFSILINLPESPKWFLINGRNAEAHENFEYIAKVNGLPCTIPTDAQFIESALAGHITP